MSQILLFGKWSFDGIEIKDPGLTRYICLKPVFLPHSSGRHEHQRFYKSQTMSIVERLVNKMMKTGRNSGKKQKAINLLRGAFEIIYLRVGKNPIQVLVTAIENSAPREETTRISYGGIVYHQAVDVAPQRRVDLALKYLAEGAWRASFDSVKTIEECLADELINAANNNPKSYAVKQKENKERIALSAR